VGGTHRSASNAYAQKLVGAHPIATFTGVIDEALGTAR